MTALRVLGPCPFSEVKRTFTRTEARVVYAQPGD
jgi:hypothetical protein